MVPAGSTNVVGIKSRYKYLGPLTTPSDTFSANGEPSRSKSFL